jgi:hypothetical protein
MPLCSPPTPANPPQKPPGAGAASCETLGRSVGSCVVAVLLIVLWIRSQWVVVWFEGPVRSSGFLQVASLPNAICVGVFRFTNPSSRTPWRNGSTSTDSFLASGKKTVSPYHQKFWGRFDGKMQDGHWMVIVPNWFLLGATSCCSALPWLAGRFSLRTLLIATTLVSVMLG